MASSAKKESLSFLLDFYLTDATRRNSTQLDATHLRQLRARLFPAKHTDNFDAQLERQPRENLVQNHEQPEVIVVASNLFGYHRREEGMGQEADKSRVVALHRAQLDCCH